MPFSLVAQGPSLLLKSPPTPQMAVRGDWKQLRGKLFWIKFWITRNLSEIPWPLAATTDENGDARPSSTLIGACEPVSEIDAGAFPAPRTVCCEHAFQRRFLGWPCRAHQHRQSGRRWQAVELVVERAAALDVGKDEVVACIRVPDPAGGDRGRRRRRQEIRTYPTFTASLEALADWLQTEGITQVVMEATGQYWKPIWYVLEERGLE